MNDTETIIKYLKLYNEWRRGDEKMGQPNPAEIGKLLDEACEKLVSLERERDSWEQTAAHYLDGMHYYRGLVERVGEALGEAAYTQDDGGKVDSVLCAKVPELVVDLKRERDKARNKMADALQEVDLRTLDYERMKKERDAEREQKNIHYDNFLFAQREIYEMKKAIIATLEENRHLADGDDCALAKLKSVVQDWK